MELLTIVTLLALLELIYFSVRVGGARVKYEITAPATTGNEMFERHYRVHYNTLEQLIVFLPALWAFGYYIGQYWAAGFGVIFLIGRLIYAVTYVKDPASRSAGALLTIIPSYLMVIGALVGAVVHFF